MYEKCIIFEDEWLSCFIAEFDNLEKATVHVGQNVWLELKLIDNDLMPLNLAYQNTFYLNMKDLFYSKNMA